MDLKDIQALIKFVSKSGVAEVSLKDNDFEIKIKTGSGETQTIVQQMQQPAQPVPQVASVPAPATAASVEAPAPKEDANLIAIKSPMIGTFYRKPSPDKDLFVNVGDAINVGDVVCVVEAMKLFNEIESEISGKIVKVLVDDSTPVEYDQPLFLVDPS